MRKKLKRANKKIKNASPLEVNGVKFRSKLEAFTYRHLLSAGIKDFKYEEHKFILQEAFESKLDSFEDFEKSSKGTKIKGYDEADKKIRSITYLPDFVCIDDATKTGWVIECKGYSNDSFPLKWKMFKKHLHDNGYNVTLFKPNNQKNVLKTIELITNIFKNE